MPRIDSFEDYHGSISQLIYMLEGVREVYGPDAAVSIAVHGDMWNSEPTACVWVYPKEKPNGTD